MQRYGARSFIYMLVGLSLAMTIHLLINTTAKNPASTTSQIFLPDGNKISIIKKNQPPKSFIGIKMAELTPKIMRHLNFPDQNGVYVQDTIRNSPGQNAGILPGDIIIKINNVEVQNVATALKLVYTLLPNYTFPIEIFRQDKYLEYSITPQALFLEQQSNVVAHSDTESIAN